MCPCEPQCSSLWLKNILFIPRHLKTHLESLTQSWWSLVDYGSMLDRKSSTASHVAGLMLQKQPRLLWQSVFAGRLRLHKTKGLIYIYGVVCEDERIQVSLKWKARPSTTPSPHKPIEQPRGHGASDGTKWHDSLSLHDSSALRWKGLVIHIVLSRQCSVLHPCQHALKSLWLWACLKWKVWC